MSLKNIAFIDGQNFYLGMEWTVNHNRFRVYLKDKYKVEHAYYFLGYLVEEMQDLYSKLQKAGFILIFREHNQNLKGKKKGNVDTDIVFEMMKSVIEDDFEKIVLISGDGDYKKTVDYLIKKERFEKILFPNQKRASSLYKALGNQFVVNLNQNYFRQKFERKKEEGG
jgi:uncharacterized LabA/DUF88 family protein